MPPSLVVGTRLGSACIRSQRGRTCEVPGPGDRCERLNLTANPSDHVIFRVLVSVAQPPSGSPHFP